MTKIRYLGVTDPKASFETLRPYHRALIALQTKCRPFGTDYLILAAAQKALETAAYHFTRDTAFYSGKPHG